MRKSQLFCLFFALSMSLSLFSLENQTRQSPSSVISSPQLRKSIATIQKLPEGKELIDNVLSEGRIEVRAVNTALSREFGAYWDSANRIVFVHYDANQSEGAMIASILFELHNALVSKKLAYYDDQAFAGRIGEKAYVEAIEHLEYKNSLSASKIADKGIRIGLFPKGAHLPVYSNFQEHFYYQQISGHSAVIKQNYTQIARMRRHT